MAEPTDIIVPLLREMRAEAAKRFDGMEKRLELMDRRLASIESTQNSFKQALTADTLMSKLITGEFEQRIEALEKKFEELEGHK